MTRVTSLGIKRTYLEASIHDQSTGPQLDHSKGTTVEPRKKKRKHDDSQGRSEKDNDFSPARKDSSAKRGKKFAKTEKASSASEPRRLKRIEQKLSETTCFACREKGHPARDCPKANQDQDGQQKTSVSIGICYRCGSKRHSLSRCKKPYDPADPFPFASCFVCNTKGHLASGCPENKAKGIYPNGGYCKLCGETTHLARNCTLRQKANDPTIVIGMGATHEAGADEDDFHTFNRTTVQLDRADKRGEKVKKMLDLRKGIVSGAIVRTGTLPLPSSKKKVVVFK